MASGNSFMLWSVGAVLSLMIFFKILSFGFMVALLSIISNMGISMVLLPQIAKAVPKMCTNDYSRYATITIQLGFYMAMRTFDAVAAVNMDMTKVSIYIMAYNLIYLLTSAGVSFATCK